MGVGGGSDEDGGGHEDQNHHHGRAQPVVVAQEPEGGRSHEEGDVADDGDQRDAGGLVGARVARRRQGHRETEEAPRPQKSTAVAATAALSEKMTRRSPTAPETALARTTAARPKRLRKNPPLKRPRVIAAANPTKTSEPAAASRPWPSTMSSGSQSLAAPSASAMASTMAPISSSFRSFHT